MKFLKSSMREAAFDDCEYENTPVINTTVANTTPR
jgi:hypothetical protein